MPTTARRRARRSGQPRARRASRPRISPPASGTWSQGGDSLTFTPSTAFPPGTRVTISVSSGRTSWSTSFRTGSYSTLRLQQLLAQLGYLPLSWSASLGQAVMPGNVAAQLSAAYQPPAGRFTWVSGYPSAISPGTPTASRRAWAASSCRWPQRPRPGRT
jgi:hypothetical protein